MKLSQLCDRAVAGVTRFDKLASAALMIGGAVGGAALALSSSRKVGHAGTSWTCYQIDCSFCEPGYVYVNCPNGNENPQPGYYCYQAPCGATIAGYRF